MKLHPATLLLLIGSVSACGDPPSGTPAATSAPTITTESLPSPATTGPEATAPATTAPAAPDTAPPDETSPPTSTLPLEAPGSDDDFELTLSTTADPDAVWDVWTDVAGWPRWDILAAATIDGSFALGATGTITNPDGSTASFTVTAFDEGRAYTVTFPLPDAELTIERRLDTTQPVTFTHRVRITGPAAATFATLLGQTFRSALPGAMDRIRRLAEDS